MKTKTKYLILFVKIPKTKVHQPGYRFSFDKSRFHDFLFLSFPFLFTYTSFSLFPLHFLLPSSSSSFFFLLSLLSFFFFFFFLFFSRSLLSLLSVLCVFWLLREATLFFIFFLAIATVVATCGRATRSRYSLERLHRLRRKHTSRYLGRAGGRVAHCQNLTFSSRAVHRDLWSR
ncbi:hypothetical protein ACOSQ4_020797 [Xanthoceras sorbifolium]